MYPDVFGCQKCVRPHWTRPNIFSGANWWVLAWNHPIAWLGHDHLKSPQREELKFSIKNLLFEPNGGGSKPINLSILMGWTSINPSYFIGFTRGTKGFDSYPNGNGTPTSRSSMQIWPWASWLWRWREWDYKHNWEMFRIFAAPNFCLESPNCERLVQNIYIYIDRMTDDKW